MTIDTTISPEMRRDLERLLLAYRVTQPDPEPGSVDARLAYERDLCGRTIEAIFAVLERGTAPTLDSDILSAFARLKTKREEANERRPDWAELENTGGVATP